MRIRQIVLKLHLWAGLVAALFLFLLGLSGSIIVFENPINRALNSKLTWVQPAGSPMSLSDLKARLEQTYPGYRVYGFNLSSSGDIAWGADLATTDLKSEKGVAFNQYTGAVLGTDEDQNELVGFIHQFHTHLLVRGIGSEIVGWASVFLLFLSITGLVLWWPRKIFKFNRKSPGRRLIFDLHNTIGIYSSAVLFVFALTGVVIHWERAAASLVNRLTGAPAEQPASRPEPPPAGAVPLGPDQLVAIARQMVPDAPITWVQLSTGPRSPVRITMKYPEDHTPVGRTRILLDAYSGKVLQLQNSRTAPAGYKFMNMWNREIHTGDIYGWPTQLLACLFSLSLPALAITGPLIWWTRRRRVEKAVADSASSAGSSR